MKKLFYILAAAAALVFSASCEKAGVPEQSGKLTFNFTVSSSSFNGTKAGHTKTGWEEGDKIFIFFDKADNAEELPDYMSITYNGDSWDSEISDELAETIAEKGEGMLDAMYVSNLADDDPEIFADDMLAYAFPANGGYTLTCSDVAYTVKNGTVEAELDMKGHCFCQIFIPDVEVEGDAYSHVYSLRMDIPGMAEYWGDEYYLQPMNLMGAMYVMEGEWNPFSIGLGITETDGPVYEYVDGGLLVYFQIDYFYEYYWEMLGEEYDQLNGPFEFDLKDQVIDGEGSILGYNHYLYTTSKEAVLKDMDAIALPPLFPAEGDSKWTLPMD